MTNQERAEKIIRAIELIIHEYDYNKAAEIVASQLNEAVAIAVRGSREFAAKERADGWVAGALIGRKEGFASAKEKIAKFIETYREEQVGEIKTYYGEDRKLAERIRSMEVNK